MATALLISALALVLALGGYAGTGMRRVPAGMVGVVHRRFGLRDPREPDSKIAIFGSPGRQAQTLRGNGTYWRSPFRCRVKCVPQTHIPNGWIGVVVAKAGAVRPPGSPLAKHVECDYFRDGEKFLREGGQQGRQQQVLTSGYYDINPEVFEVITANTPEAAKREDLTAADLREIDIPVGETGVIITHMGARPDQGQESIGRIVDGHESFQLPWEFLKAGGQKGVQKETLDEGGRYEINPWFAHVVRIPTRKLILEWTKGDKSDRNLDTSLEQIVLDVQGYTVRLDMKQIIQIPAAAAPGLVCRFGDSGGRGSAAGRAPVQQFVEKELAATVAGYFRKVSGHYEIQEFVTQYDKVCDELAAEVRLALGRTHVLSVDTVLEEFQCDQPEINELRRRIAEQQERAKLEKAHRAELEAQRENAKVKADIEAQKLRTEEALRRLEHIGVQVLAEQLGPEHVARERIVRELVKAKVPETQIIGGGNGDIADSMLSAMPAVQATDILRTMFNESASKNNKLPQADPQQAVTSGSATNGAEEPEGTFEVSSD